MGSTLELSFPNSKVRDAYTGRDKSFEDEPAGFMLAGYVVPETGNPCSRELPFWPLCFSRMILYVDPDYKTALMGYPGR